MSSRLKTVDAIVFDLDGTLISYPSGPFAADEHRRIRELTILLKDKLGKSGVLAYWQIRSKLKNLKDLGVLRLMRDRTGDILEALSYSEFPDLRVDLKNYQEAFHQTLLDAYLKRVSLYPDVLPCLSALRSDGFRLGLLSNGPSFLCDGALDRFGIRHFFDFVGSTWTLKTFKPNPQIFLYVSRELGVKIEYTLFVGDSLDCDVKGAREVGALSAYIVREHNPLRSREALSPSPDLVLRSLEELPPMVKRVTLRARFRRILRPILRILLPS